MTTIQPCDRSLVSVRASVSLPARHRIVEIFPDREPTSTSRARFAIAGYPGAGRSRAASRQHATELLAALLDSRAESRHDWTLNHTASGAPQLLVNGEACPVNISLAHCGDAVAVGVARGLAIGVDLEYMRHRPNMQAISEFVGWSGSTTDSDEFYARWTLWEAFAKCVSGSLLNKTNHRIENLTAHRSVGRMVFAANLAALCDCMGGDVMYSFVLAGDAAPYLAHRVVDLHELTPWPIDL
jgi:phosphopantetheinyl transferase